MNQLNIKLHKKGYGRIFILIKKYFDLSYELDYLLDIGVLNDKEHDELFNINAEILRLLDKIKKGFKYEKKY